MIGIDQEGGQVARLRPEQGFPPSISQQQLGALDDLEATRQAAETTAQTLRAAGINNFDISMSKKTAITETMKLEFRAECFNAANRTQFGNPNTALNPSLLGTPANVFGKVTTALNQPRLFQLALRLTF
ncbi:MAG: hypothetical protein NTW28_07805, partial [Candidatus Solibacter sp.]|nr:hypothetical protein [Candidatus Solibacter sp.]